MMRSILASILILIAAGVGWLTYDWYRARTAPGGFGAPFTLVDQNGAEITEAAFRGAPSAVFFGFTHCPEICPTTLYELDGWLNTMGDEGKDIRAYFVTVDPARDTAEVMNAYVGNVSARIVGITGEPEKVEAMVRAFNGHGAAPPGHVALARLAPAVMDAAARGDAVAREIVEQQGKVLADYARVAAGKVGLDPARAPIVLTGGVFRHTSSMLPAAVARQLSRPAEGFLRPRREPAMGALMLALEQGGIELTATILERLDASAPDGALYLTAG